MPFEKPERIVERVFIHCSASDHPDHDDVDVMRRWHTDPPPTGRGWRDVGYHFFIRKTGRLETGRPLELIPAAQAGHNARSIAICMHGLKQHSFTGHQFNALVKLCKTIDAAYESQVTFHGHREVSSKSCPVFDFHRVLGLSDDGSMTMPPSTDRQEDPEPLHSRPVVRLTDRGDAVMILQMLLNRRDADLLEDGIFGRVTFEAVVEHQLSQGLEPDGIVGPATWASLT